MNNLTPTEASAIEGGNDSPIKNCPWFMICSPDLFS